LIPLAFSPPTGSFTAMARKSLRRKPEFAVRKTPFLVILAFTILGLIGISTGEPQRVLEQAIRVCLSCIGIG